MYARKPYPIKIRERKVAVTLQPHSPLCLAPSSSSARPPFSLLSRDPMQYSPRVRSPLCSIENVAPSSSSSTSGDGVFKKPLAPASRMPRSEVVTRERAGSSAGICSMPLRLTRSSSSIEPYIPPPLDAPRRSRGPLTNASNAVPIPSSVPQHPAPASMMPAVTTVAAQPQAFSPPSSFNMTALNANLPATSAAAPAQQAPDSPDSTMDYEKIPVFPTITNSDVPDFPCISADTVRPIVLF